MPVSCPQFLRHQSYINSEQGLPLNQEDWKECGYKCYKFTQEKGDMIITWPGVYHSGINTGWNLNEAVNFAMRNWLEEGKKYRPCSCIMPDGSRDEAIKIDLLEIERKMILK
jgi:hypothetical protein